jgi:hypothetical protein
MLTSSTCCNRPATVFQASSRVNTVQLWERYPTDYSTPGASANLPRRTKLVGLSTADDMMTSELYQNRTTLGSLEAIRIQSRRITVAFRVFFVGSDGRHRETPAQTFLGER